MWIDNYDVAARIGINRNIFRGVGSAGGGGSDIVVPPTPLGESVVSESDDFITTEG